MAQVKGRGAGWGQVREIPGARKSYGIRYTVQGKRYTGGETFSTKGAARAELDRIKRTVDDKTWLPPAEAKAREAAAVLREAARSITVREWAEEWLEWKGKPHTGATGRRSAGLKAATIITYRSRLAANVLPWVTPEGLPLADTPLSELSQERVNALMRHLEGLASRFSAEGNGVAVHTGRVLQAMLTDAAYQAKIDAAPTVPRPLRVAVRAPEHEEMHVATEEQLDAVYEAMPAQWRIAVLLGVWCQLRVGEVLGLRRQDVVWSEDGTLAEVRVRSQISTKTGERTKPKSKASQREIAVPVRMLERLRSHLAAHTGPDQAAPVIHREGDPGKPVPSSVLDRAWRAAKSSVPGLEAFRFHDLRHTGLSYYGKLPGVTLAEIMRRAGHKDPQLASVYFHPSGDRDRALAALL